MISMSEKQKNPLSTRSYRNHSNIKFGPSEEQPPNSQKANYRSHSQVGKMMNDAPQQGGAGGQVYHYSNKIVQREQDYSVPANQDPQFQKNNEEFQRHFVRGNNKFAKPYDDCTKYVDSLMQNKQLLRRGQFDLPVSNLPAKSRTKTTPSHIYARTQNTEQIRSVLNHRKNYETMENIRKKGQSSRAQGFDKTLQSHFTSYQNLMKEERWSRGEQVGLKNSMNRMLAAEMINFRLMSAGDSFRPTRSVRLGH